MWIEGGNRDPFTFVRDNLGQGSMLHDAAAWTEDETAEVSTLKGTQPLLTPLIIST